MAKQTSKTVRKQTTPLFVGRLRDAGNGDRSRLTHCLSLLLPHKCIMRISSNSLSDGHVARHLLCHFARLYEQPETITPDHGGAPELLARPRRAADSVPQM